MEDSGQCCSTKEVAEGGEVWDGAVVRVCGSAPHVVHHHVGEVEQQPNLEDCSGKVEEQEQWREN